MAVMQSGPSGAEQSKNGSAAFDRIQLRPKKRSFVVGSTGSGKSTLSAALLQSYYRRHRDHFLWIIDPKRRFVPLDYADDEDRLENEGIILFPDGYRETNHGMRDGVAVFADLLHKVPRHLPAPSERRVYLIQDESLTNDLLSWLYHHSDVRTPSLVYCDESFDMVRHVRAIPSLRRILQQGREIGVGMVIVNQRPAWIDQTFLSEADTLFIGALNRVDDRERLGKELSSARLRSVLERGLPPFTWLYSDQSRPSNSRVFTVRL